VRIDPAEMRQAPPHPWFARVWIELSEKGAARLYLEHGASDRLLMRDVPGSPDNPELVREELGHILQAAVEGLKAGEEIGEPRERALQQVPTQQPRPVAPLAPPPAAPAKPRPRARLRYGASYELRWLGDGARLEDGPGASVALTTRTGAELSGYYRRPVRVEGEAVSARFEVISLRALATWQALDDFRLAAGLGGDFVRVTPLAGAGQSFDVAAPRWRRIAVGRVQATYGYRASSWLELQLSAGADVDASGTRYVVEQSAGDVTVLHPSPLRPFVSM
jgi:hypothetical protein